MIEFIFVMAVLTAGLAIMAMTESDNTTRLQLFLGSGALCALVIFLLLAES